MNGFNGYITDNISLIKIQDHTAAGTSTVTSSAVDMQGYDGALFFTSFGTAASNNTVKLQQSSDDGGSDDYTDLTGTSVTSGSSDEDVWIDYTRPGKRYLKFIASRGTSSTLESMWVLLYHARTGAINNSTTGTIVGEQHNGEAEGTA